MEISDIEILFLIATRITMPIKLTTHPTFIHCFILRNKSINLQFSPSHCFKFHLVSKIRYGSSNLLMVASSNKAAFNIVHVIAPFTL